MVYECDGGGGGIVAIVEGSDVPAGIVRKRDQADRVVRHHVLNAEVDGVAYFAFSKPLGRNNEQEDEGHERRVLNEILFQSFTLMDLG